MRIRHMLRALLFPLVCQRCGQVWTRAKAGDEATCPCCAYAGPAISRKGQRKSGMR